jgi:hypothetical protein
VLFTAEYTLQNQRVTAGENTFITNSMETRPSSEPNSRSVGQDIPRLFFSNLKCYYCIQKSQLLDPIMVCVQSTASTIFLSDQF